MTNRYSNKLICTQINLLRLRYKLIVKALKILAILINRQVGDYSRQLVQLSNSHLTNELLYFGIAGSIATVDTERTLSHHLYMTVFSDH